MINVYDSNITDILPDYLKSMPEVQAISYAISNQIKKLKSKIVTVQMFHTIDVLPEDVLNLLAIELRTQYYDEILDVEVKRGLIKNTLIWYMRAGTPSAIEELVTTLFGIGEVEEWFDYGGKPYRFRVTTNAPLSPDEINEFFEMIYKIKNTRSHLEGLNKNEILKKNINVASALSITKVTTINSNQIELEKEINVANGLSITKITNIKCEEE